jgi:hypothetical protein
MSSPLSSGRSLLTVIRLPLVCLPPAGLCHRSDPRTTYDGPRRLMTISSTARRFKKQIFLSVDVPPAALALGQGPAVLLAMERRLVATLKEMEGRADPSQP